MKKEMKIVLPFYKIAYAVSFVVILSVIRAVVFTYEIGLSIELVSDKKENLFYYTETDDTGNFFAAARCSWIWIVFCVSETNYTSSNRK